MKPKSGAGDRLIPIISACEKLDELNTIIIKNILWSYRFSVNMVQVEQIWFGLACKLTVGSETPYKSL